jgi:RHS repeat-associated protein
MDEQFRPKSKSRIDQGHGGGGPCRPGRRRRRRCCWRRGHHDHVCASVTKDGWGNAIRQFDPYGNQINLAYDTMGRLQSKTNPFPANGTPAPATTYQYDTLGRTTVVTLPNNQTVAYSFSGSTLTVTDQVGRKKQQQYDGLGRLASVTEQDPSTGQLTLNTSYTYDLLDDLTQVNQGGQVREFKYDAAKRKLYERLPEQSATINDGTGTMWSCSYTYTSFDAIASRTDARGVVTSYGYDTLNRLVSRSYNLSNAPGVEPTNSVAWTYDTSTTSTTKGLLLSITMTGPLPTYQENFYYDSLNRLSSRTWTRDSLSYTIRYQYNNVSQLGQLTYPSGRVINIAHDSVGRVSSVSDGSGVQYVSNLTFNPAGFLTSAKLGNGVTETFGYDSQTLQATSETATAQGGPSGGLLNLNYSYQAAAGQLGVGTIAGNAGQMVSITNSSINGSAETAAYSYDLLRRLTTSAQTSNGVGAQRRFAYDRWGNRTGMWDSVSGGNQLQSISLQQAGGAPTNQIQNLTTSGTVTFTYDGAGNLTNDGVHTYQYDGENRLRTVDSGATASYAYDYQNRRFRKNVGGVVTHYVWDKDQVLAEHNGATGANLVDYVLGAAAATATIVGGTTQYLLRDGLSERLVLDTSGSVLGRMAHLPFGEDFAEAGQQEKHHFAGYERDSETGIDYAVNRGHSSVVGRFRTADPYTPSGYLVDPQSWNRYSYARNDSVNRGDPTGLVDLSEIMWWAQHYWYLLAGPLAVVGRYAPFEDSNDNPDSDPNGAALSNWMLDKMNKARDAARKILSSKNPCSDFFGPNALKALDAVFGNLTSSNVVPTQSLTIPNPNTGIEQSGGWTPHDGGAYRTPGRLLFNGTGPFFFSGNPLTGFSPSYPTFGGYVAGSLQAEILMILHEDAHDTSKDGKWVIPDDGGNDKLSEQNSETIKKNCGNQIDAAAAGL